MSRPQRAAAFGSPFLFTLYDRFWPN